MNPDLVQARIDGGAVHVHPGMGDLGGGQPGLRGEDAQRNDLGRAAEVLAVGEGARSSC
jgi:hypothetical protein